jgi:uncharacterized protein YggE
MRVLGKRQLTVAGITVAIMSLAVIWAVVPGVSAKSNVGAQVKAGNTNHTISVGGHGEVSVPPDQATISLGVQTQGNDAQAALSSNASKMSAVIAAVEAQGVPSSHIQTSELSMWYDSEHNTYVVTHSVTARLDNVDRTGQVLDAAVAAGANNSWGVSFGLKDPSAARGDALKAAVADSRIRANSMASALGVTVSGVGSASEAAYQVTPPEPVVAAPVRSGAAGSTPVQPGQLTVSADVNIVYTFG